MIPCAWKHTFGFDCLMCGFQRAFGLLFEGDILGSLKMYPPLIPLLFVFVFTILHLFLKFKKGPKMIIGTFVFAALVMVVNYSFKIYSGDIYH